MRSARFRPILSVVVPVYNEAANVAAFLDRTLRVLQALNRDFELLFVDDGSCDETASRITAAAVDCPAVRLVRLSRNFGHQAALVAGLAQARGAAVITMDGDLQHPPELIPQLVAAWDAGADVVQAVRRAPVDDSPLKRAGSRAFYRLLSAVSRLAVTPGASDFRLMSRPAVDAFLACPERCRFNRGLVHWIGFTRDEILYEAATRHAGRSKYSWSAMIRLAGDAIFSFSSVPLRLAGLAGACVSVVATFYLLFVLGAYFFT
ncbi:MAG TPA: glycosyltransferase family 2 protein, partial [Phycisphaerae bacterium]|nr:glycosyltransferase family 2 protein [Phycisphaerae bacterium]